MLESIPKVVIFFPNGLAAVCGEDGRQIPGFQGTHAECLRALREKGISLEDLDILGRENIVKKLDPRQCCERDYNFDGDCHLHPPGSARAD